VSVEDVRLLQYQNGQLGDPVRMGYTEFRDRAGSNTSCIQTASAEVILNKYCSCWLVPPDSAGRL